MLVYFHANALIKSSVVLRACILWEIHWSLAFLVQQVLNSNPFYHHAQSFFAALMMRLTSAGRRYSRSRTWLYLGGVGRAFRFSMVWVVL